MDANNFISTTEENEVGCENGVNKHLPTSEQHSLLEKDSTLSGNDRLIASSCNSVPMKDVESVDLSPSELVEVSSAKEQNDSVHSSEEHEAIEQAGLKDDKPHKVAAQTKNQKLLSPKPAATTDLITHAASNGTPSKVTSGLLKSKPSNDNPNAAINHHHKPVSDAANGPKQLGKAQPKSSSAATVSRNETHMDKRPYLVKNSGTSKSEGTTRSSRPTSSETRNIGALLAYGFSFKCDERADKRREFYSKLEEKIQAKEAENSNLQAKSQETREAELKMLRQSLKFKATLMPSFYQEPAPPKTELKKVPPTRAKSPKLGRKKISSTTGSSEEEVNARANQSRSLDVKLARNILPAKDGSLVNNVKKSLCTSLPKLPSQNTTTNSLNEHKRSSAKKPSKSSTKNTASQQKKSPDEVNKDAADDSNVQQEQEDEGTIDPSKTEIEDILIEMPTHEQDHADANVNHVKASKDIHQPKNLRKKAVEKSSDDQETINDPIAVTLCQQRFVLAKRAVNLCSLPYELLVEIAKWLKKFEDFTCLRSVSRSFHLTVEDEYFEGLRFRKSLPYLMLPPVSRGDGNDDIRQFYNLTEGESIVASLKVPTFKTSTKMCFESLGWLLTVEVDGSMSLLDPFTDTEIPVPHLHTFPRLELLSYDKRFLMSKMVLSSRPNETSDFIMMVIIGDCCHLAFWRLGDKAWNKVDDRKGCICDVVYGGGEQFYAIGCLGIIWAINLAAGHAECRIIIECRPILGIGICQGQYILKTIYGSLLAITRTRDKKFFLTSEFQVYDIDIETGQWKEICSLGSMAVFLGRNSSIAVDATATSSNGGGVIKANHIYFTDDFVDYQYSYFNGADWRAYAGGSQYAKGGSVDCGAFNFETRDVEPIYPVEPLSNVCPAMWITPNLCF